MIVQLSDNVEYTVSFHKEGSINLHGNYDTYCTIRFREGKSNIGCGKSYLNPKDQYNKFTGKKVALKRAIEDFSFNRNITKKDRKIIWDAFISEFSHLIPKGGHK